MKEVEARQVLIETLIYDEITPVPNEIDEACLKDTDSKVVLLSNLAT